MKNFATYNNLALPNNLDFLAYNIVFPFGAVSFQDLVRDNFRHLPEIGLIFN